MTNNTPGTRNSNKPAELHGANDEAAAMLEESELARHMIPQTLKACAGHGITCPVTGNVLDYRTVIVVTVTRADDDSSVYPLSPEAWHDQGQAVMDAAHVNGLTVDALTLRHMRAAVRQIDTDPDTTPTHTESNNQ